MGGARGKELESCGTAELWRQELLFLSPFSSWTKLPMAYWSPLLCLILKLFKERLQPSPNSDPFLTNTLALWDMPMPSSPQAMQAFHNRAPFIFKSPAQRRRLAHVAFPPHPDRKPCLSFLKTQEASGAPSRTVLSKRVAFSTCGYLDLNLN